jgi:hypothetical protein
MKPAAVRLLISALLFCGWIGYLLYLVLTLPTAPNGQPIVLSRPQFLVSDLDVIAQSDSEEGPVTIKEVLYPQSAESARLVGQTITVANLGQCQPLPRAGQKAADVVKDWQGAGEYLLPLRQMADGQSYEVVPTPASPGYPPTEARIGPPRIYPATPSTLSQYRLQIHKPG